MIRKRMRKINKRNRILFVFSQPRLRIGCVVKIIQKYVRRFVFLVRRWRASIAIQTIYRGYRQRGKWMLMIYQIHTQKINKIKRVFYLYKLR